MADRSVPRPVGKPSFVPKNNRETPEDDEQDPKVIKPTTGKRAKLELRKGALGRRLRGRVNNAKPTTHQQHMAHLQHQANVKNNPRKYG